MNNQDEQIHPHFQIPDSNTNFKKDSKLEKYLVFLFGGLIFVGILAFVIFKFTIPQEESFENLEMANSSVSKEQLSTTTEISTWKTYRNEEYNFEVTYPEDWRVDVVENGTVLFYSTIGEMAAKSMFDECIKKLVNSDSSVCANPYIQDFGFVATNPNIIPTTRVKVGQVKIGNLIWNKYKNDSDQNFIDYELIANNNGYTFYGKDEFYINQILSTFKFISTSTEVTN